MTEAREGEIEKELAAYKASLTEDELETLVTRTKMLKKYQEEPSRPEDLEKIPILEIKDIEPDPQPFAIIIKRSADIRYCIIR